jgi:polyferredoxin
MKNFLNNKTKLVFQVAVVGLILVLLIMGLRGTELEKYCPFGGIMSLGSKLWMGSMSCSMGSTQVFMGIALLLGVILFSKLFCGYLCPIGTVTEWLNKLYAKVGKNITLRGIWDRVLRAGKYVLLFFTAYFTITTSELWCKKFDPYYASVSGFDGDVVMWAGILTIISVIFLSVFIRFFWCKYACPLGALSNLFQNAMIVIPVILLYVVLVVSGVKLDILWLILLLCIIGAAIEIFRFKFFTLSPFKIHVDKNHCISCELCDNACPLGIEVSKYDEVDHPDCTLCLDCVKSCQTDSAISLAKTKHNWIPPVAIIVLIGFGIFMSKQFTMTTLSERWDNFDQVANIEVFEMEDLKSVHCYGSSKSLQTKLMRTKGIHGLDTWGEQNRVNIFYDADDLTEKDVKEAIFTPSKYRLRDFPADEIPETVTLFSIPVDEVFDTQDNNNLIHMLMEIDAVCGMETNFGEPVSVIVAYKTGETTPAEIREIIDRGYVIKKSGNTEEKIKVKFECATEGEIIDTMTYRKFLDEYFQAYDRKFNKYEEKDPSKLAVYEIGLPGADSSTNRRRLPFMTSHLSFNDNIVRLRTLYTDRPVMRVYFVEDSVTEDELYNLLTSEKLKVMLRSGATKEFDNIYTFKEPAGIVDIEID